MDTDILIAKLKDIGLLKYGLFKLKSGAESSYYCDFRTLLSYPQLLKNIYHNIDMRFFDGVDLVCGVFFGGMPLANLISFERNIPQIFIRDSEKTHGTKKQIEGIFESGQTVLVVEDVITTGQSILEKIKILEQHGLNIRILTILNRSETLARVENYPITSILPLDKIVGSSQNTRMRMNKIYEIAFRKRTNIVLSADLTTADEIIRLLEETKSNILGVKLHSDIIADFFRLREYLDTVRDELIIIEDCKVADISFISIQKVQYYACYADYITYHCVLGTDLPRSLKDAFPDLGLLGVVEMSVKDCLIDASFMQKTEPQLSMMDGCVIQKNGMELFGRRLPITFSPGISLNTTKDDYNQTYRNPQTEKVGEFWIVGRGIYAQENPAEKSTEYRALGWKHFISFSLD